MIFIIRLQFLILFLSLKNDRVVLSGPLLQDKSSGKFNVPTSQNIDRQLLVGSGLFGFGWGVAGMCPVSTNV